MKIGATVRRVKMSDRSKSGRGLKPAGSTRRRANARRPTTYAEELLRDGPGADVVTQDELREYHDLRRQKDRLEEEIEERRLSIIRRLEDGASILPGFFDAEISAYLQRRLTADTLEEVLGPEEVERLKGMVAPTRRIQLRVTQMR
jgi:hypothetical protein